MFGNATSLNLISWDLHIALLLPLVSAALCKKIALVVQDHLRCPECHLKGAWGEASCRFTFLGRRDSFLIAVIGTFRRSAYEFHVKRFLCSATTKYPFGIARTERQGISMNIWMLNPRNQRNENCSHVQLLPTVNSWHSIFFLAVIVSAENLRLTQMPMNRPLYNYKLPINYSAIDAITTPRTVLGL